MIEKAKKGRVSSLLRSVVLAVTWCASPLAIAASFPQTVLLSQLTNPALPIIPGTLQRSQVQWHTENLGDVALAVRHIIEPMPALKLEVVFDGELRTFALARSWHGHLSDDPGAQVTLTHYRNRLSMTIDSPKHGVIAVRDSTLNPVDNTIQGVASIRDIDHVPFVKDDPNSYEEMVQIFRGKTATAQRQVDVLPGTGRDLAAAKAISASAVNAASAEVDLARRGRDDVALSAALLKLRLARVADAQLAQSLAKHAADVLAAQRALDAAVVAESDMNLIQIEAERRRSEWSARATTGTKSIQARSIVAARTASPLAGKAKMVAVVTTGQALVKTDAFGFSAGCTDPVGEIDVAVVVSSRLWTQALSAASAVGSQTQQEVAVDNLTGEITHALDMANTALKRSAVSHPAFDIGFRLIGINPDVSEIPDISRPDEPLYEWKNFSSDTGYRTKVRTAAQNGLFASANQPDLILSIIVGDDDLSSMRGVATMGDPDLQSKQVNAPYAVVKMAALNAPETHAMAHELGHILGAGHDAASAGSGAGVRSWARGQTNIAYSSTSNSNLSFINRETLLGLSECASLQNSTPGYSCRRIPFYSNQQVPYPYYGGVALGDAKKDNAAIMRQTRNMMARVNCSNPVPAKLWFKKQPSLLPNTLSGVSAVLEPLPWEAQSLWRRNAAEPGGPPSTYQHQNLPTGTQSFFVNTFVHNPGKVTTTGVLEIWRVKPPIGGGRWLSPLFSDLERLSGSPNSWCRSLIKTVETDANGNTKIATGVASGAWGLEAVCANVPFATADDPLFIRWIPTGLQAPTLGTKQLVDMAKADVASLWRSMSIIPLEIGAAPEVRTVVLRKSNAFPRTVQLSIKPVPGQGNFNAGVSGINTLEIESNALSTAAPCVNTDNSACVVVAGSITSPTTVFQITPNGAELNLLLPARISGTSTAPPTSAEVPVKLTFTRAPNAQDANLGCPLAPCANFPSPDLPPTDVLIRVIEFESKQVRGGASFVVQAKRQ